MAEEETHNLADGRRVILTETDNGVISQKGHRDFEDAVESIVEKYNDGIFELKAKKKGARLVQPKDQWMKLRIDLQKKNAGIFCIFITLRAVC